MKKVLRFITLILLIIVVYRVFDAYHYNKNLEDSFSYTTNQSRAQYEEEIPLNEMDLQPYQSIVGYATTGEEAEYPDSYPLPSDIKYYSSPDEGSEVLLN